MPNLVNNQIPGRFITSNTPDNADQGAAGLPPQAIISVVPQLSPTTFTQDAVYQNIQTNSQGVSLFVDYLTHSRYERDDHIYMIPTTSPAGSSAKPVVFCQLAQPTILWVADWTASKLNEQPEIPNPNLTAGLNSTPSAAQSNWVTMDQHLEPVSIGLAADGKTPLYRISGTYFLGCIAPSANLVNDISFGRPPWMPYGTLDQTMPTSKLTPGIITQ